MDLALNNLQKLICHKTNKTNRTSIFLINLKGYNQGQFLGYSYIKECWYKLVFFGATNANLEESRNKQSFVSHHLCSGVVHIYNVIPALVLINYFSDDYLSTYPGYISALIDPRNELLIPRCSGELPNEMSSVESVWFQKHNEKIFDYHSNIQKMEIADVM